MLIMSIRKKQIFEDCPWPYYEEDEVLAVSQILKSGKVNYWTGNIGKGI